MCGLRQLFFQCGPEMPRGWIPLEECWLNILVLVNEAHGIVRMFLLHKIGRTRPKTMWLPWLFSSKACIQIMAIDVLAFKVNEVHRG